jgi:hypothetical protein
MGITRPYVFFSARPPTSGKTTSSVRPELVALVRQLRRLASQRWPKITKGNLSKEFAGISMNAISRSQRRRLTRCS